MKVAVIGGGISGLAAAYRLRRAEHEVVVLEAAARAGGKVFSERVDGFLVEHGPNGFLDARLAAVRLARDVGLGGRMVAANEAASRRFLFSNGALRPVPLSPPAFLKTDLLSTKGKLRLLSEPLVPPRKVAGDESVFDFAARRIGPEAAEMLVDPMVAGIYAGDPRRLSLPAAFPRLRTLEEEHGGLVRGMIAGMAQKRGQRGGPGGPGGQLTSFPGGMSELIDGLVAALDPGAVQTGRPVSAISRRSDRGWRVTAAGGDALDVDG
ncbi:MAG: protoporphyrinogen oxidase, partial [Myxococcales bacterium]|nr:protoporphyrinogen oxidase [Myxococcales bacterium]